MDRVILHSDLNAYFASVEMRLDPSLQGKAVAVCGSEQLRHGIVLAKSEKAKRAGVKTGMALWEARKLCPDLVEVPPHREKYVAFSALVREIYARFTDYVEPYGLDECWLDVSMLHGCGDGRAVADRIRRTVKDELGLTVSVGVSFNKIFAKLGSDLKKPDAVTVITRENFKEKLWGLPVGALLYVGRATEGKLLRYGISTIGRLAETEESFLRDKLGVHGSQLWRYANGLDDSPVRHKDDKPPVKSVGQGVTCAKDLSEPQEVWQVLLALGEKVGSRLRRHKLEAKGVQIAVKDSDLQVKQFQCTLLPTQSGHTLAKQGMQLFEHNYRWHRPVRALTLTAIYVTEEGSAFQPDLFFQPGQEERQVRLERTVDAIRDRFGEKSIRPASLWNSEAVGHLDEDE